MITVNDNFLKLKAGYLFPEISRRVAAFQEAHPDAQIIKLGIGDVTLPLAPAIIEAFHAAVDEMGTPRGMRGYGPEQGYAFLRQAIRENDYAARGVEIEIDEIFVSDGSKCDSGNIQEIFGLNNVVAVSDPVYPVYVDTNVMAGRTGPGDEQGRYQGLVYMPCTPENGFMPEPPEQQVDLIYLCYPNNPTGAVPTRAALARWVDYARDRQAIILYDAAYEAFITEPEVPHSIYEVEGARDVAIEFRSFSKSAGFTGTRCAFTVVPKRLQAYNCQGHTVALNPLWNRRHCTKFNGVSYPVQRAAEAVYGNAGRVQVREQVNYYLENARLIRAGLTTQGYRVYGGVNAPYVWLATPNGMGSWAFFDHLLAQAHVVSTPGAGFGSAGEGFLRLSAFGSRDHVKTALERIAAVG